MVNVLRGGGIEFEVEFEKFGKFSCGQFGYECTFYAICVNSGFYFH